MSEMLPLYTDLDLYLKQNSKRDLKIQVDAKNLEQCIENILLTIPGARCMNPLFGSLVTYFLFKPATKNNAEKLADVIIEAIETWEKRVQLNNVTVVAYVEKDLYYVEIDFTIKATNRRHKMTRILKHLPKEMLRL